jgi:hypothetical protein
VDDNTLAEGANVRRVRFSQLCSLGNKRVIAPLDKSLGDRVPALQEKRLREVHEGEVQLALRPSGIGEVGVILSIFIWFDG